MDPVTTSYPIDRRAFITGAAFAAGSLALFHTAASPQDVPAATDTPLPKPASGPITVAFAISQGATVIDFAGPWEVFQDVLIEEDGRRNRPFKLVMVGPSKKPVRCSAGMVVVPDYSYADAPQAQIVVVPAQAGSAEFHEWLRARTRHVDVTMSVCTGAFHLGSAGLLEGLFATTHHDFYDQFESKFTDVKLVRSRRFVDNGKIAAAGGLTSGFDMALHIVARYFGQDVARKTAAYMEYDHYTGSPVRATA